MARTRRGPVSMTTGVGREVRTPGPADREREVWEEVVGGVGRWKTLGGEAGAEGQETQRTPLTVSGSRKS